MGSRSRRTCIRGGDWTLLRPFRRRELREGTCLRAKVVDKSFGAAPCAPALLFHVPVVLCPLSLVLNRLRYFEVKWMPSVEVPLAAVLCLLPQPYDKLTYSGDGIANSSTPSKLTNTAKVNQLEEVTVRVPRDGDAHVSK